MTILQQTASRVPGNVLHHAIILGFCLSDIAGAAVPNPPEASVWAKVEVSTPLATHPFHTERTLRVPPNFRIAVYARIPGARFMAIAPNGDLLVSQPGEGRIYIVRPDSGGGDPKVSVYKQGLRYPHDIVFHTIGGNTFLYLAESHRISRFAYTAGDLTAGAQQVIVDDLPDSSSPELKGVYGHQLKNIALHGNYLYLSIASASNNAPSDTTSNPSRCSIYRFDASGGGRQLFATGLRNAEGLAFVPGTDHLWAVVNNSDNIAYPYHHDITGDGIDDYGRVYQPYVDNHPPEEFTRVREGANYGWPFAHPNPDTPNGMDHMPFDPDYYNNRDWSVFPPSAFARIDKGIQAHSAPLGLSFLHGTQFHSDYRSGAVVALHGSWNRSSPTGYKVVYFPWDDQSNAPGNQRDLVAGWYSDATGSYWGRPVDAVPDPQGNLLISDDHSGTIYKLSYADNPPPPAPEPFGAVTSFSIVSAETGQPIPGLEEIKSEDFQLDLAQLPTTKIALRANTDPATVGSVAFGYDDLPAYKIENYLPYCINGDSQGVCANWSNALTPGTHTVTATPYAAQSAQGLAGKSLSVRFTVAAPRFAAQVESFSLINSQSGEVISGFENIRGPELVLDAATLPTTKIALRANTDPGTVGSVVFSYDDARAYQLENYLPYCINGDSQGICSDWSHGLTSGMHTVTATPYSQPLGLGLEGISLTIGLRVQ